ncbi:hypothetical protein FBR05_14070 [Deltaproteobacteria bacterium PRO3]|nr:hypothetical protein [Deltaproteobacteria bacterium PRO3]
MRLLPLVLDLTLGCLPTLVSAAQPPVPASTAVPGSEQIASRTLANGLKIIVWPDHDIPNANFYTFYKVGSRNERGVGNMDVPTETVKKAPAPTPVPTPKPKVPTPKL